jgi:hypothetical protein
MTYAMSVPTVRALNTDLHRVALSMFMFVVAAHWAEHVAQALQIYVLGMPVSQARGVLGMPFPWLVHSEWLHYGYAVAMLAALVLLLPGFTGRARAWWKVALYIQVWHHFEHVLLLIQASTGSYLAGRAEPTSVAQLFLPRVELHLFYNAIVFAPMVVAMVLHRFPSPEERARSRCGCAPARS